MIDRLILTDFKNYSQLDIQWSADFVGLVGENGAGKTNILDAIYYICTTKSYFNATEQYNFRHDAEGMALQAQLSREDRIFQVSMKILKGRKKEVSLNKVKEDKLAEYVGRFPVVIIAPNDNAIILGGSEERRKMIDAVLCQADIRYTELLMQYNKVLTNRNALLKQLSEQSYPDDTLLDTIDLMLSQLGEQIYVRRNSFVEKFSVEVSRMYSYISQEKETATVIYRSHLADGTLDSMLKSQRNRDLMLQRTTRGVHLDDLELLLDGHPLKKVGSQGQQKTFIVAMKMALFSLLLDRKKIYPILLLDDIFEKFDQRRVDRLFRMLGDGRCGQVFVTDTHPERLMNILESTGKNYEIFKVNEGYVKKSDGLQV